MGGFHIPPDDWLWLRGITGLPPRQRLAKALRMRPAPAAYEHALVAVRAMVRASMKAKAPTADHVEHMYRLLCQQSFLDREPFLLDLEVPAYNVALQIPMQVLDALEWPYGVIGFAFGVRLHDRRWCEAAYGPAPEPGLHPRDLYGGIWRRAKERLRKSMPRPLPRTYNEDQLAEWREAQDDWEAKLRKRLRRERGYEMG